VFRGDTTGGRFHINSCEQFYRNLFEIEVFLNASSLVSPLSLFLGLNSLVHRNEL
jgi:hypothetical protein